MVNELVVLIGMLCHIKDPKVKYDIKIECIDHYVNCLDKKPIAYCNMKYKEKEL
jgi:hypothetical protein